MLEALRQPLEGGEVAVAWAAGGCCFPVRFQLTAPISPSFLQIAPNLQ
jgi:predicted ATPase with chaperone activity